MIDKIAAGEFKAKCLRLQDEVQRQRRPIVITKRGKPVAKLVPVDDRPASIIRKDERNDGDYRRHHVADRC